MELVDNLVKVGMKQTYDKLMYVRDQFKCCPGSFNSNEMNLKILFKEKFERD